MPGVDADPRMHLLGFVSELRSSRAASFVVATRSKPSAAAMLLTIEQGWILSLAGVASESLQFFINSES